ncbi:hypothetical protein UlMin_041604 [Ulmus minor]
MILYVWFGCNSLRSIVIPSLVSYIYPHVREDCMIVTSALIIWKALMCVISSESPVVVVLSGSMEPGSKRGDILFLHMSNDPIHAREIVVFNVDGRKIPIVHRVIKHCKKNFAFIKLLKKSNDIYLRRHLVYSDDILNFPYIVCKKMTFIYECFTYTYLLLGKNMFT